MKNLLNLPMHTARIPPVDPAPAAITAALAMHAGHIFPSSCEIPQDYSFCPLLASARSLIRSSWCFHSRSNVLVHSYNGRIAIAFTL